HSVRPQTEHPVTTDLLLLRPTDQALIQSRGDAVEQIRAPSLGGSGRCRAMRLLHFRAAPSRVRLTLKRQLRTHHLAERRFDRSCYAAAMADYLPSGWPEAVAPPGSEGWEATAVARLLDLAPRYRQYEITRRYPVILAYIARHHIHGSLEGAREGYRT